jgi:nucleoside-diphosphate-sugar epimerase
MISTNKVLILGATGGIGGEIARKLIRDEWDVRALRRSAPQHDDRNESMTWISGDAQNAEQVEAAASDCSVIVHAVNPPGYRNWEQLVLPMLHNTINAAERNGALIVLPGTIYNYGPMLFPLTRGFPSGSGYPKRSHTRANGEGSQPMLSVAERCSFCGRVTFLVPSQATTGFHRDW